MNKKIALILAIVIIAVIVWIWWNSTLCCGMRILPSQLARDKLSQAHGAPGTLQFSEIVEWHPDDVVSYTVAGADVAVQRNQVCTGVAASFQNDFSQNNAVLRYIGLGKLKTKIVALCINDSTQLVAEVQKLNIGITAATISCHPTFLAAANQEGCLVGVIPV